MAKRRPSALVYEGARAMLSLAGIRMISQSKITGGGAGSNNTYTVLSVDTRRVIIYVDHASNIVRLNIDAAATANHIPVKNQVYLVVDVEKGQVINLFDTTGGTLINVVEIE